MLSGALAIVDSSNVSGISLTCVRSSFDVFDNIFGDSKEFWFCMVVSIFEVGDRILRLSMLATDFILTFLVSKVVFYRNALLTKFAVAGLTVFERRNLLLFRSEWSFSEG